tara:strand:+ start:134 stop:487 length:354 start_codon:yes stop_codon:yes gene_type:complete
MSLGTTIYTLFFGKFVGKDSFGNKYYSNSNNYNNYNCKRWVIFSKEIEASNIPPHWHAWLHKTVDEPPINYKKKYDWEKDHLPNLTGTSEAYFPESHPLSKSKTKVKEIKNYEKWKP